ncbi:MAG: carbohydrate ABC transporter permease [Christensenellales bacterium]|jgi:putative aldouronate transport system permease protein|nr:carbohydrate ABC transporter permease [Christensenellaceae bacterium]
MNRRRAFKIRDRGPIFTAVVYIVMFIVLLACTLPFLYIIAMSFSSSDAILKGKVSLFPVDFSVEAYRQIFAYPHFFRAYKNTILYTVCGTAISLVLMVLFAYPLSKTRLKGQKFVMKLVVFSMFFSGGMIPNYLLISSLGLTGTVFAMILPFAINQFNLIILVNFFKSIPEELEEAARIDGLNYFGILIQILLPLSTAALATIGLYTAVFFWNDWFYGLIYLNSELFPVMLLLRNIVNGTTMVGEAGGVGDKASVAIAVKSAVILTSTLPIILLYPFLQKYFVKGMLVGAVKG